MKKGDRIPAALFAIMEVEKMFTNTKISRNLVFGNIFFSKI